VARLAADPEGETAEFALFVRSDRQDRGLGGHMLDEILDYARRRGIRTVWGSVIAENRRMLDLTRAKGFVGSTGTDPSTVRITIGL
jgi:acetyltransferase